MKSILKVMSLVLVGFLIQLSTPVTTLAGLTAPSIDDVFDLVNSEPLEILEKGRIFGYYSTDSCLFAHKGVLVLKNYCYPKKKYPAKSFTIISPTVGIIGLYQENLGKIIQRRITIKEFPETVAPLLPKDLMSVDIDQLNEIIEKLYYTKSPACWTTNLNRNKDDVDSNCYLTDIKDFSGWSEESLDLVLSAKVWNKLFSRIEALLPRYLELGLF